MSKKNSVHGVSNQAPAISGVAAAPSAASLLKAPDGYRHKPGTRKGPRARTVLKAESHSASAAAAEIQADESLYVQTFGSTAPSPASVATGLSIAANWSSVVRQVRLWLQWATEQEIGAWSHTFVLTNSLRPVFESAVQSNASVGETYAAMAKFFAARHAAGAYAARQRKAKAKGQSAPSPVPKTST